MTARPEPDPDRPLDVDQLAALRRHPGEVGREPHDHVVGPGPLPLGHPPGGQAQPGPAPLQLGLQLGARPRPAGPERCRGSGCRRPGPARRAPCPPTSPAASAARTARSSPPWTGTPAPRRRPARAAPGRSTAPGRTTRPDGHRAHRRGQPGQPGGGRLGVRRRLRRDQDLTQPGDDSAGSDMARGRGVRRPLVVLDGRTRSGRPGPPAGGPGRPDRSAARRRRRRP